MYTSRESFIRLVVRHSKTAIGPITIHALKRAHHFNEQQIYRCFPGGFNELLTAAGPSDRIARIVRLNPETLLADLDRLAQELGHFPTYPEVRKLGRYSMSSYSLHFGRFHEVKAAYDARHAALHPDPFLAPTTPAAKPPAASQIPLAPPAASDITASPPPPTPPASPSAPAPTPAPPELLTPPSPCPLATLSPCPLPSSPPPSSTDAPLASLLGAPLGFRGLLHAPTSESGVVHLFGLLGPDLGYAIETIGTAFPDCRALRPEPGSAGRWRRISIEFELRSSNFHAHKHNPGGCDLIVCWEHDWPDCPLQVIELKSELRKAAARPTP